MDNVIRNVISKTLFSLKNRTLHGLLTENNSVSRKKTKRKIKSPRKPPASSSASSTVSSLVSTADSGLPLTPLTEALGMMQTGDLDMALALVDTHLQSQASDSMAYHLKGLIYHRQAQYEKAIQAFEQSIEISPPKAPWYLNLGLSFLAAKKQPQAISAFKKTLEIDGDFQLAQEQLVLALSEANE